MTFRWKPISTAPTDGTLVLLAWEQSKDRDAFGPVRARYRTYHPNAKGNACWRDPETGHKFDNPTHWCPVPVLPGARSRRTP